MGRRLQLTIVEPSWVRIALGRATYAFRKWSAGASDASDPVTGSLLIFADFVGPGELLSCFFLCFRYASRSDDGKETAAPDERNGRPGSVLGLTSRRRRRRPPQQSLKSSSSVLLLLLLLLCCAAVRSPSRPLECIPPPHLQVRIQSDQELFGVFTTI